MGPTGVEDDAGAAVALASALVSAGARLPPPSSPVGEGDSEDSDDDSGDDLDDDLDDEVRRELEEAVVGFRYMVYVVDTLSQVWMV